MDLVGCGDSAFVLQGRQVAGLFYACVLESHQDHKHHVHVKMILQDSYAV